MSAEGATMEMALWVKVVVFCREAWRRVGWIFIKFAFRCVKVKTPPLRWCFLRL